MFGRTRNRTGRGDSKYGESDTKHAGGNSKYGGGGGGLSSRPSSGSCGGSNDSDYYQMRIMERKAKVFSIWSTFPSPPSPVAAPPNAKKTADKPKRRSPSPPLSSSSESSSSEDERRRRRKKTSSKKKSRKSKSSKKAARRRSPSPSSSDGESDREASPAERADEAREAQQFREAVQGSHIAADEPEVVGPMPLHDPEASAKGGSYGRDLLPGEGAAIAQYVQKNMRIPRRGEVGWSGNEIESLETAGYVMSGSRHQRMNAVRIRKENQVYSAEEKRALALINFEEKQQRENNVMAEFRNMLTDKLTKKHGALVVEERQDDVRDHD
ncbi:hypothetical protein ACHHYP_10654 [Achlya hypogyna]|uniref:NF-kappa-B-activating protein C-terminal domain-containing protein n=1 Tax=Achlya hypogyna TaxID=1202772 RepID=A0A1V9YKT3_ACHHY|nr:hypothetical protein ACHHYP_10654 [Achlya hypogyna]